MKPGVKTKWLGDATVLHVASGTLCFVSFLRESVTADNWKSNGNLENRTTVSKLTDQISSFNLF